MGIIDGAGNHHHGKGTPDGGRFAAKTNSAPGKELTDSATVNMDTVPVRVAWIEPNVLPTPRHRLPRSITRELDTAVDIPVLTEEEAPTGFLLKKRRRTGIEKLELRVHDGRLYRRTWKEYTPEKLLNLISISERDKPLIVGDSEEEVQANLRERADEFVVIGDEIWKETPEPVYYAQTFGLGGVGNGGTSLFIGHAGDFTSEDHTTPEYVFPAHQREEAIWYTRQLAEQRGDLHSIDHIGKDIFIEMTDQFEPGSTFRAAHGLQPPK